MGSVSCHITPLVINGPGGGHTHMQTHIMVIHTGSILRNQACASCRPTRAWFKNRAVLSFQNIVYVAMWSLVMYSKYLAQNLLKEQMMIKLYTMVLLKVHLYLLLFITVS